MLNWLRHITNMYEVPQSQVIKWEWIGYCESQVANTKYMYNTISYNATNMESRWRCQWCKSQFISGTFPPAAVSAHFFQQRLSRLGLVDYRHTAKYTTRESNTLIHTLVNFHGATLVMLSFKCQPRMSQCKLCDALSYLCWISWRCGGHSFVITWWRGHIIYTQNLLINTNYQYQSMWNHEKSCLKINGTWTAVNLANAPLSKLFWVYPSMTSIFSIGGADGASPGGTSGTKTNYK